MLSPALRSSAFSSCEITRSFLTHYNKITGIAYERIDGAPSPTDEGAEVSKALRYLDGDDKWTHFLKGKITLLEEQLERLNKLPAEHSEKARSNFQEISAVMKKEQYLLDQGVLPLKAPSITAAEKAGSASISKRTYSKLLTKKRKEVANLIQEAQEALKEHRESAKIIAQHLDALFFYPMVSKQYVQEHKGLYCRTNESISFYRAMARHLHIALLAYPELSSNKEDIVEAFVTLAIKDEWKKVVNTEDARGKVREELDRFGLTAQASSELVLSSSRYTEELSTPEGSDVEEAAAPVSDDEKPEDRSKVGGSVMENDPQDENAEERRAGDNMEESSGPDIQEEQHQRIGRPGSGVS